MRHCHGYVIDEGQSRDFERGLAISGLHQLATHDIPDRHGEPIFCLLRWADNKFFRPRADLPEFMKTRRMWIHRLQPAKLGKVVRGKAGSSRRIGHQRNLREKPCRQKTDTSRGTTAYARRNSQNASYHALCGLHSSQQPLRPPKPHLLSNYFARFRLLL